MLQSLSSTGRCLWPALYAHTTQALATRPVSAAIANANILLHVIARDEAIAHRHSRSAQQEIATSLAVTWQISTSANPTIYAKFTKITRPIN